MLAQRHEVVAVRVVDPLELDLPDLGLLTSAYFLAFALAQLPVGVALDRFGPRVVQVPMLFLQGTRDALADLALLREVLAPLAPRATLALEDDADHAFHVRVRSGRSDAQVLVSLADTMAAWIAAQR